MNRCIHEMKPVRIGKTVLLFVVVVILISSCACKKKDDFAIVGNWRIQAISSDGTINEDYILTFQGDEWAGDVYKGNVDMGDYFIFAKTVFIKDVSFSYRYYVSDALGYFHISFRCLVNNGDDRMNGSLSSFLTSRPQDLITGTWTGSRQ